ncbi:hypothetical protein GCM10027568_08890 [Humibacter soli]
MLVALVAVFAGALLAVFALAAVAFDALLRGVADFLSTVVVGSSTVLRASAALVAMEFTFQPSRHEHAQRYR